MSKAIYIGQQIHIKPTYIVSVPEYAYDTPNKRTYKQRANEHNLKNNSHNGNISKKAQQKVKNAINWLLVSAKKKRVYSKLSKKHFYFKVNFITLTLPAHDKEIKEAQFKRLLHGFIQRTRYSNALKNYVWRLERQANGRLHVHLTTDCFIHYKDVQKAWNEILYKNGLLVQWYSEHGNYTPPSTEIHAVKNVKNLGAYLAKYFTKPEQGRAKIKGKIWGCNYELSSANKLSIGLFPDEVREMKCLMHKSIRYKEMFGKQQYEGIQPKKVGEIFFVNHKNWDEQITGQIREAYDNRRFHIRYNIQEVDKIYNT